MINVILVSGFDQIILLIILSMFTIPSYKVPALLLPPPPSSFLFLLVVSTDSIQKFINLSWIENFPHPPEIRGGVSASNLPTGKHQKHLPGVFSTKTWEFRRSKKVQQSGKHIPRLVINEGRHVRVEYDRRFCLIINYPRSSCGTYQKQCNKRNL